MEIKILPNGKKKYFYSDKDVVIKLSTKEQFQVKEVKEGNVYTYSNEIIPLTIDIQPTQETLDNAVVKRVEGRKSDRKPLPIKIKYLDKDMPRLERISIGDWCDLRALDRIELKKGEFKLVSLGVAMELPKGYEAYVVPRSGTYKNFKIIQTNHQGIIDNSYCGDSDIWKMPVYAMEDTVIEKYDRICQFRIQKKMPDIEFIEVEQLGNENRGGFSSTGTR